MPWADGSGPRARAFWDLHREILRLADGKKIIVILPDDSYCYGGVQELLLKGASDFPTWEVSTRGQSILDKFAPGMVFRHEGGRTLPDADFPRDTLVVWFEKPGCQPLTDRYRLLREAMSRGMVYPALPMYTGSGPPEGWAKVWLVR